VADPAQSVQRTTTVDPYFMNDCLHTTWISPCLYATPIPHSVAVPRRIGCIPVEPVGQPRRLKTLLNEPHKVWRSGSSSLIPAGLLQPNGCGGTACELDETPMPKTSTFVSPMKFPHGLNRP
jgi:hypothetical protein